MKNLGNRSSHQTSEGEAAETLKMVRLFERLCSDAPDSKQMQLNLVELIRELWARCHEGKAWFSRSVKLVGDAEELEALLGSVDDQITAALRMIDAEPELGRELLRSGRSLLRDTIKVEWGNLNNLFTHEIHTADLLLAGKFKLSRFMEWEEGMGEIAQVASSLLLVEELLSVVLDAEEGSRQAAINEEHMERWDGFLASVVYYTERKMQAEVRGRLTFALRRVSSYAGRQFFEAFYPYLLDGVWAQEDTDDEMSDEEFDRAAQGSPWWIGPKSQLNLDLAARQLDLIYDWACVNFEFRRLLNAVRPDLTHDGAEPPTLIFEPKTNQLTFVNTTFEGWNNAGWIGPPPGCAGFVFASCLMKRCDLIMTPAATRWKGINFWDGDVITFQSCTMSFDSLISDPQPDPATLLIGAWLRTIAEVYQLDEFEPDPTQEPKSRLSLEMVLSDACTIALDGRPYMKVARTSFEGEVSVADAP